MIYCPYEEFLFKNENDIISNLKDRLLGRFAPVFYFNFYCGFICEHLLFVQYETKAKKKFADFIIFFLRIFKILQKLKTFKHKFLKC